MSTNLDKLAVGISAVINIIQHNDLRYVGVQFVLWPFARLRVVGDVIRVPDVTDPCNARRPKLNEHTIC